MNSRSRMIIDMFKKGASMRTIGNEFGITRNAVAGIIHRARAGGERIEVDGASVDKPNLVTELRSVNAPRIGRMPRLPQLHTQGMCMDDFFSDDQPDACGVGLMDLKLSSCRYIVGEVKKVSRYCGEPKSHGSYCAHHGSLCYVSPGEVKRRLRQSANDVKAAMRP